MSAPSSNLDAVPIEINVVVGSTTMPIANFLRIEVGSILGLGRSLEDPVDLIVSGRVIAKGSLEVFEDSGISKLGVRISEVIHISGITHESS